MDKFADGVFYRRSARDFPVRDRQIIEIDAEAQISDAFGTLLTHNLLCAPVWDSQQAGYLGFFDVDDALSISYDIDLVSQATGDSQVAKQSMRTTAVQVIDLFNKSNQMRNPDLEAPWIPVGIQVPMREVLSVLGGGRARRVPVVDTETGKVLKIISQMDIVRQLHLQAGSQRERDWPEILQKTPLATGVGMKHVVTITEEQEARDAFRRMIDDHVSCVGVVDDNGMLIGCISNKDIQVVMRGTQKAPKQRTAPMMAQTTKAKGRFSIAASMTSEQDFFGMLAMIFVGEVRRETERNGKTHVAVCELSPSNTFKEIIDRICATGHHRVFLVDDDHRPVGIVSVADICALILREVNQEVAPASKPAQLPPPVPKRSSPSS